VGLAHSKDDMKLQAMSKDVCGTQLQAPRQCVHIAPDRLWPSELVGALLTVSTKDHHRWLRNHQLKGDGSVRCFRAKVP